MSAASASRWRKLVVRHDTPAARPPGGDLRPGRIDALGTSILDAIKTKDDVMPADLQVSSAKRGTLVNIATL